MKAKAHTRLSDRRVLHSSDHGTRLNTLAPHRVDMGGSNEVNARYKNEIRKEQCRDKPIKINFPTKTCPDLSHSPSFKLVFIPSFDQNT